MSLLDSIRVTIKNVLHLTYVLSTEEDFNMTLATSYITFKASWILRNPLKIKIKLLIEMALRLGTW